MGHQFIGLRRLFALGALGVAGFVVGCGSTGEPVGQSGAAVTGPSGSAPTPTDPVCPVGERLCTLGGFNGSPCVHECVIDTAMCIAAPQCEPLTCPPGEKICTFGDIDPGPNAQAAALAAAEHANGQDPSAASGAAPGSGGDPSAGGSPASGSVPGSGGTAPNGGPSSGAAPHRECITRCVPDTWLCVDPPPYCGGGGPVCDPACAPTQTCCPGGAIGTTICLNPNQLDHGTCPPLP